MNRHPGPPRGRHWLSWALKALITSALLYYVFSIISFAEVGAAIRGARLMPFAAAVLLGIGVNVAATFRLRELTRRQALSPSWWQLFEINFSTNFYGLFLPGFLSGGVVRWHKLYLTDRNAAGALVAIVLNRFLLTTTTVGVGLVFWSLAGPRHASVAVGLALAGMLAGLLLVQGLLVCRPVSAWVRGHVERSEWIPNALRSPLGRLLVSLSAYHDFSSYSLLWMGVSSLAEEILGVVSFWLVAQSVGIQVSLVHLGWIRASMNVVTMLPVSISGFGVREGTLVALLAPYGVPGAGALALSFLHFARSALLGAVGGSIEAKNVLFRKSARSVSASRRGADGRDRAGRPTGRVA